jgi:hypothetical protein
MNSVVRILEFIMMSENNKSESCDKSNHRTHHTRFFEKLYGNLEKSDEKKLEDDNLSCEFDQRRVVSPSESSVSSNETYPLDKNYQKNPIFQQNHDLTNLTSNAIFPNHFGSLRIPFGFPPESHNHFAAFCK